MARPHPRASRVPLPTVVVLAALVVVARFAVVGSDAYWLVALGRIVAAERRVPVGVPFAAAPTSDWVNVPVLAELVFAAVAGAGGLGFVLLQLAVVAVVLAVLVHLCGRRVDSPVALAGLLLGMVVAALPWLVVVRLQTLSLVCFVALLALLDGDARSPSRRLWLAIPLVALWGNLHGAVLVGVGLLGCYLLLHRARRSAPVESLVIGVAALAAVLATPAGWRTIDYYAGALTNEAAASGAGMWARPSPTNPLDVILFVVLAGLLVLALRGRAALWETVAALGLLAATVTSARHGIWALLVLALPAARGLGATGSGERSGSAPSATVTRPATLGVALVVVVATLGLRGPDWGPAGSPQVISAVRDQARGSAVLADAPLAETLAAEGIRVWVSNPLDAFDPVDQRAYLAFLAGRSTTALDHVDTVVVVAGGPAASVVAADPRFRLVQRVGQWQLFGRG